MVFYASAGKGGRETRHVPRNRLSINLPDGMLDDYHIAARGFRGMAGSRLISTNPGMSGCRGRIAPGLPIFQQ
jgi:hypothetical protein